MDERLEILLKQKKYLILFSMVQLEVIKKIF